MKRREFIRIGSAAGALMLVPEFIAASAARAVAETGLKRLVIIHLSGGNDGLNTIVPFRNDVYYRSRPKIALQGSELLAIDDRFGWNPALKGFDYLMGKGWITAIQGVGYPEPNRSHFRSSEIWQSASDSKKVIESGWIGRWMDETGADPWLAVEADEQLGLSLKGEKENGMAVGDPSRLLRLTKDPLIRPYADGNDHAHDLPTYLRSVLYQGIQGAEIMEKAYAKGRLNAIYPVGPLSRRMQGISRMISGGAPARVYYAQLAGFDTHVAQPGTHARLLSSLGDTLKAFAEDLHSQNLWKDTLVMVYSEFGRRVEENAGSGTDHGTAGPLFLLSGSLRKAGVLNEGCDLSDLEEGDLKYTVDFRAVYADVLATWLGGDPQRIIGAESPGLGLF